jgi:hypothetical protein
MFLIAGKNTKFCWICGKDVALDHCTTDEHGLAVHTSCDEKRIVLKAAAAQTQIWLQRKPRIGAQNDL